MLSVRHERQENQVVITAGSITIVLSCDKNKHHPSNLDIDAMVSATKAAIYGLQDYTIREELFNPSEAPK